MEFQLIFPCLLCLLIGQTYGEALSVYKCNGLGLLESVQVTNCSSLPCSFERGRSYSLFVTMIAKGASTDLKYTSSANIFGLKVHVLSGNACELLIGEEKCPIKDGAKLKFKFDVKIPKYLPQIQKLTVNATVLDDNRNVQACAGLPAKIV